MPANAIPVRRVPLLCGPAGNGGAVLSAYPRAMGRAVRRGTGANGTRGAVAPTLRGSSAQQIPYAAIPQAQLESFPYGVSAYGAGWPFGVTPSGGEDMLEGYRPRPQMRAGSRRVGMGDIASSDAQAATMLGKPKGPGEYYSDANAAWAGGATTRRACEIGQSGMKGACKKFGMSFGAPSSAAPAGDDNEARLYKTAIDVLNRFTAQLAAGQVDPSSAVPGNADGLPPNQNAANAALYSSYQSAVSSLASARLQGQAMWRLLNPGTTSTTTPGTTTTTPAQPAAQPVATYDPNTGLYTDPYTGQGLVSAGSAATGITAGVELTPINAQAPAGTDPIYGSGVEAGTGYVQSPFQTKPAATPTAAPQKPRGKVTGAEVGIGALVVAAVAFALLKKKRA